MGWDPWLDAASNPDLHVRVVPLPDECGGGVLARRRSGTWILLDEAQPAVRRREILGHELVHLEEGPAPRCDEMPDTWDAVVGRVERRIDQVVADRMIPPDELAAFVREAADDPVTARLVAERFETSIELALDAMTRLAQRLGIAS